MTLFLSIYVVHIAIYYEMMFCMLLNICHFNTGPLAPLVDLSDGLDLLLDLNNQSVTFVYQGRALSCSLQHIQGQTIYPLLVFKGNSEQAVSLAYLLGPSGEWRMTGV